MIKQKSEYDSPYSILYDMLLQQDGILARISNMENAISNCADNDDGSSNVNCEAILDQLEQIKTIIENKDIATQIIKETIVQQPIINEKEIIERVKEVYIDKPVIVEKPIYVDKPVIIEKPVEIIKEIIRTIYVNTHHCNCNNSACTCDHTNTNHNGNNNHYQEEIHISGKPCPFYYSELIFGSIDNYYKYLDSLDKQVHDTGIVWESYKGTKYVISVTDWERLKNKLKKLYPKIEKTQYNKAKTPMIIGKTNKQPNNKYIIRKDKSHQPCSCSCSCS